MYELLVSKGYSIYRIIPNGLVKINTWDPNLENFVYSNYFAALDKS